MDSAYPDVSSLWDLSQPVTFPHLADDDLMAMLQKQFPLVPPTTNPTQNTQPRANGGFPDGVNPQTISRYSLSSLTPPSEDSSPSPPETGSQHEQNVDDAGGGGGPTNGNRRASMPDSMLKRKASVADYSDEGPSQKTQHTSMSDKKGTASSPAGSRRKSTGGVAKDEGRLLKRKEQNRAAQRAFRERKEKHVKDLEDKVAELEAKNEVAQHENENLRDLLSRLQSENVMLKQSNFTFTMTPKSQPDPAVSVPRHFSPENSVFSASPSSTVISPESLHPQPKPSMNLLDWTSLTSFDPNMLNLLDESPQTTATSSAMNLDIFAPSAESTNNSLPFTTIASNPMFMSYASNFDSMLISPDNSTSIQSGNGNDNGGRSNGQPFNFDLNSLASWPTPTPPTQENTSMDDLFAGYLNSAQNSEFSPFTATPSISPVAHKATVTNTDYTNLHNTNFSSFLPTTTSSNMSSNGSSPSSQSTTSSEPSPSTPKENQSTNGTANTDHTMGGPESASDSGVKKQGCPKTKSELVQRIVAAGASPFAPSTLQKSSDNNMGTMVSCAGSKFPRTAKNDKNVEVLSAWRSITSDPMFKDANIDINNLCSEFTSKAKCDGTKVVLEPEEMHNIMEALAAKKH